MVKIVVETRYNQRPLEQADDMADSISDQDIAKASSMTQFGIEGELGHGSFGQAFLVKYKPNDDWYVVKISKAYIIDVDRLDKSKTFQEADIMQRTNQDNIVKIYAYFVENCHFHMVMEFCNGGTLKDAIVNKSKEGTDSFFPEGQVLHWLAEIAMALMWLHARNIVHRDIKAANIFLKANNERRTIKLGDFGTARTLENSAEQATTFAGTPTHMAPELVSAQPYSFECDIWSFGVVAYEIATLKLPFPCASTGLPALYTAICNAPIAPIGRYSQELRDLIEREMLVRDVSQRATIIKISEDPCLRLLIKRLSAKADAKHVDTLIANQTLFAECIAKTKGQMAQLEVKLAAAERQAANFEQEADELKRKLVLSEQRVYDLEERLRTVELLIAPPSQPPTPSPSLVSVSAPESNTSQEHGPRDAKDARQRELFEACSRGNTDQVRSLLQTSPDDVNATYQGERHGETIADTRWSHGTSCLDFAASNGHVEMARVLIEDFQVDVDHQDAKGCTALHSAVIRGNLDVVRLLCEKGNAQLELKDKKFEMTPLMWAAQRGAFEIVQYLLERDAEVNEVDNKGRTALALARDNKVKELLKNYGANRGKPSLLDRLRKN